jgi:hypothetical protein
MTKENSSKKKDAKAEIDGTNVQGIDRRGRPIDSAPVVETTTTKTRKKKGKKTDENMEEDESSSSKAESAETSKVDQASTQQDEPKQDESKRIIAVIEFIWSAFFYHVRFLFHVVILDGIFIF